MSEFKDSIIGQIPVDWDVTRFEELLKDNNSLSYGVLQPGEDIKDGVPMLRTVDISNAGLSGTKILKIPQKLSKQYSKTILKGDEVLLSVMGTIGRVIVVKEEWKGWNVNRALAVIRLNQNLVYNLYLSQLLKSHYLQTFFENQSIGSAQKRINLGDLREFLIPLPPLPEQQKIAEILSTVDEKIEVIDQQIEQTKQLKKGLMQRLLTKGIGHTKFKDSVLGEIPESWEVKKLREVGSLVGGNAFKATDFTQDEEGYQVIRMSNVQPYGLDLNKAPVFISDLPDKNRKFILKKGDLLITLTGTIGKTDYGNVAYIDQESKLLLNQRVGRFQYLQDKIQGKFLFFVFVSKYFKEQFFKRGVGGTGNQANVGKDEFETINILLPYKEEQIKIESILSTIEDRLKVLENKKKIFEVLKKGLMQKLLTGKIRVNHLIEKEVQL